ncbi:PKD domain-containing protein [Galbibacter sp. EGI 63066]|uniref:PKD domain-containing protein n=1 Tax=Galbibacter sp. EGI 63066 TaxID=2993559 RepID=UPI0022494E8C|nr:PKD domain-containing protein [Galbibacter sp. EGI 63066]MCX2680339.1 PKD domain-containing protein [Galbibacter sp. EGI 63066]
MNPKFILLLLGFCYMPIIAQQAQITDSLTRKATFEFDIEGNTIDFSPETPTLIQIAGAPKAFYSYYWEFGDGNFSREKNPQHNYEKQDEYQVRLWATNHYDNGKPPTTRPQKVKVDKVTQDYKESASMTEDIQLLRNREPIPEEEIVVVLSYKNAKNYTSSGKIHFFFNEQKYKADNFELTAIRKYHNERIVEDDIFAVTGDVAPDETLLALSEKEMDNFYIAQDSTLKTNLPLTLEESKAYYRDYKTLDFNEMPPGEERNIFFSLKTTPEMLKDTSAIISVRGIYIPDNNYDDHKVKDMEMEIVTSHDPNRMSSTGTFMNYRLVRFKRVTYKIKFQNNGEGPARTIRLETDIPDMYDKSTIEVEDMYPKCPICPKKPVEYSCLDTTYTDTQAIFTFKNIYLPGSEQKNVKERDSTKGFVKYSLKFGKDFHKKKTKSKTAIIFDKNEPIITNYSATRFIPGISIGAKAGYNHYPDLENSKSPFVGVTVSPYKSYRWYWQAELVNSFHSYEENTIRERINEDLGFGQLERTTTHHEFTNLNWEVPLLLKYNINNYLAIGSGLQANFNLSQKRKTDILTERYEGPTDEFLINSSTQNEEENSSFTDLKTGVLFDVTAGFARIGPSVGARYVINFENSFNYWQFYARWKF